MQEADPGADLPEDMQLDDEEEGEPGEAEAGEQDLGPEANDARNQKEEQFPEKAGQPDDGIEDPQAQPQVSLQNCL